jgi:TRAP-type mannitol/chloroaromatic compound transport system permease small subunit
VITSNGFSFMSLLLQFSRGIDALSTLLAKLAAWTVLAAALISAINAMVRYGLDISSNGWLEVQWYLFATGVMLGAPYVLKVNEHVRVDIFYGRLKGKTPVWLDLLGLVCFLLPVMGFLAYISTPLFIKWFLTGETSNNAGGLVRWPVALLLPVGFGLVFLQGLAEVIKRVAYLRNPQALGTDLSLHYEKPVQ